VSTLLENALSGLKILAFVTHKSEAARYLARASFLALALMAWIAAAHAQGYDPTARAGATSRINPLAPGVRPQAADTAASRYDPNDEYSGLPRTEGVETVVAQCTYCHSAALVMQQRLSRERWDERVNWMIAERGMPEPDAADRKVILDYLAAHFSDPTGPAAGQAKN